MLVQLEFRHCRLRLLLRAVLENLWLWLIEQWELRATTADAAVFLGDEIIGVKQGAAVGRILSIILTVVAVRILARVVVARRALRLFDLSALTTTATAAVNFGLESISVEQATSAVGGISCVRSAAVAPGVSAGNIDARHVMYLE